MNNYNFLDKVKLMPNEYQMEIKDFIEFVWTSKLGQTAEKPERTNIIGAFKGKVWMSKDFDEPLDDFKDYM